MLVPRSLSTEGPPVRGRGYLAMIFFFLVTPSSSESTQPNDSYYDHQSRGTASASHSVPSTESPGPLAAESLAVNLRVAELPSDSLSECEV